MLAHRPGPAPRSPTLGAVPGRGFTSQSGTQHSWDRYAPRQAAKLPRPGWDTGKAGATGAGEGWGIDWVAGHHKGQAPQRASLAWHSAAQGEPSTWVAGSDWGGTLTAE